jgi:hypothetical protein
VYFAISLDKNKAKKSEVKATQTLQKQEFYWHVPVKSVKGRF